MWKEAEEGRWTPWTLGLVLLLSDEDGSGGTPPHPIVSRFPTESMDLCSLLLVQPGAWLLLRCYQQNSALFKAVASLVCSFHCSVIFGNSPTISSLRRTGLGKLLFLARKYFKYRHPCCNWIRGMLSEHHPKSKSLRAQQKDPRTRYKFFFLSFGVSFVGQKPQITEDLSEMQIWGHSLDPVSSTRWWEALLSSPCAHKA